MFGKKYIIPLFLLIFISVFSAGCNFQNNEIQINEGVKEDYKNASVVVANSAAIEVQIEIIVPEYRIDKNDLTNLQSLPMPELYFVFSSPNETKMELPESVKNFLNEYWKETIRLRYELIDLKSPNYQQKTVAVVNLAENSRIKLEAFKINAPDGERIISNKEARQILKNLNWTADDLIEKAKGF